MSDQDRPIQRWENLRHTGMLWAINATLLHPRGFAMGAEVEDSPELVDYALSDDLGWKLLGDGSEPWSFADTPETHEQMRKFEAFLAEHRA